MRIRVVVRSRLWSFAEDGVLRGLAWLDIDDAGSTEHPARGTFGGWCHYRTSGAARVPRFFGNRASTVAPASAPIGNTRTRGSNSYACDPG
jgi:hypothetical protein